MSDQFAHLLALVRSLVSDSDEDFVLSEELFESEMDCILVNECLELSRFEGKAFNRRLIEKKVKFVSILFDFGFVSNSLKYCQQMKAFCDSSRITQRLITQIESRFDQNISTTFDDNSEEPLLSDTQPSSDDTTPVDTHTTTEQTIESIPPISEVPESASFDFYPQNLPPVPTLPFNEPPVPTLPFNGPAMGPNIAPMNESLSEENIAFSFVSSSQSLPTMPFNSNQFFENGFQNKQNESTEDKTTTDDRNDRSVVETDNRAKATNSGFLSKLLPFNFKRESNQ